MKNENLKWWAYRHENGEIIVKRYFDEDDLKEADESFFVKQRTNVFESFDRSHALRIAYILLT